MGYSLHKPNKVDSAISLMRIGVNGAPCVALLGIGVTNALIMCLVPVIFPILPAQLSNERSMEGLSRVF